MSDATGFPLCMVAAYVLCLLDQPFSAACFVVAALIHLLGLTK